MDNLNTRSLQSSFLENRDENKAVIIFVNALISQTLNFTFDFDGNSLGIFGDLKVQYITENTGGPLEDESNYTVQIQRK
jgi:hypothetical protein